MSDIVVGVLALQGDFREHIDILRKLNVDAKEIRFPGQLENIDGLIIPGGESTTIGKLLEKYGFNKKISEFYKSGKPVFGTCAGLIVIASEIAGGEKMMGLIDIDVERNAYGRQLESFEQDIKINLDHDTGKERFNSIFIRAPKITRIGEDVRILGKDGKDIVLARQDNVLVSTFHPELTGDIRIHKYFISMILENIKER